ncbi:TonB-dependent receptor [Altererythrobacter sp. SALINAS58]|uniref:TonB-dependent receptor n=1 Tax=Alteripontixanthobacter muriae TaxID=2705546 RepID=UPI00157520D3|nr:TonB-dependent receptor [Alteripontixanthobacter muriae]NTZ43283.1 TonB-dependent receptor [Alteripontixanthobacter muriae]
MYGYSNYTHRAAMLASTALLAMATPAQAQDESAPTPDEGVLSAEKGEVIIVTAQRREQLLIDVPLSISVVGEETLERQVARSFIDYAQLVPGLTVTQENPGETRLILRGINTGSAGSTVATYVDDIPFGASGSLSNGAILAGDFDTFDVARVEVLRGPQGTLYGSNSLGGVLKFVTNKPDTDQFEMRAQAGVEDTRYGELSYLGNAMVNVPLGQSLAFRVSGFYRDTGGYVGAPARGGSDVNGSKSYGGRASLLFTPTEALSIRLMALLQKIETDSPSSFQADPLTMRPLDALTGAFTSEADRTRFERIAEFNDLDYRVYSGTADYDFGFATLTSITSYSEQTRDELGDISTNAARGLANAIYAPASPSSVGLAFENDVEVEKFTQEVRLQSVNSDRFEWLIGAYYTDEKTALIQEFLPFELTSQAFLPTQGSFGPFTFDRFVVSGIDANYEEMAGFANATFKFSDRFDVSLGGRYSHNEQSSTQQVTQLGMGEPQFGDSSEGVFTYSVSPRFELSDWTAIYARVAKGYRSGGPTFIPPGASSDFPTEFDSDTLVSYEVGLRTQTVDGRFALDGAVYYVDWENILIISTADSAAGPVGVNTNGGRARVKGAELTATMRPTRGFNIVGTLAYVDAELLDDTVPPGGGLNLTGGLAGDQLPYTPEISANISADYEWSLGSDVEAFIGGNVRLVGDQTGGFNAGYRAAFGERIRIDGYETVDLRAGVNFGRFTMQAFARNVFDTYGVVSAGGFPFSVPADLGGNATPLINVSTIRPRTIGLLFGAGF